MMGMDRSYLCYDSVVVNGKVHFHTKSSQEVCVLPQIYPRMCIQTHTHTRTRVRPKPPARVCMAPARVCTSASRARDAAQSGYVLYVCSTLCVGEGP